MEDFRATEPAANSDQKQSGNLEALLLISTIHLQ